MQASTVESGRNASARMSAVVRRFNARRKWLSFMGLDGFFVALTSCQLVQGWRNLGGTSIGIVRKCFALSGEGNLRQGVSS